MDGESGQSVDSADKVVEIGGLHDGVCVAAGRGLIRYPVPLNETCSVRENSLPVEVNEIMKAVLTLGPAPSVIGSQPLPPGV